MTSEQNNDITAERVADQLKRIRVSASFRASRRMIRFLELVVSKAIHGEGEELKEYVIGTEVFEKGPKFDPRLDSIVRVEARRLRRKLRTYYQDEGQDDAVVIEVPVGSYAPVFHQRPSAAAGGEADCACHVPSPRTFRQIEAAGSSGAAATP